MKNLKSPWTELIVSFSAKAQDTLIEDGAPLENAPIEGDEDAAARYRSKF